MELACTKTANLDVWPHGPDAAQLIGPNVVHGVATCDLGGGRVYWIREGRGNAPKIVHGWLIAGVHVEAQTLAEARRKAASVRRSYIRAASAAISAVTPAWITLDDARRVGACKAGIEAFCMRYGLDPKRVGAMRSDVLLSWEPANPFLRRAAEVAKHKIYSPGRTSIPVTDKSTD